MNDISNNVLIRHYVKSDINFIKASWLRSYRYGSLFAQGITNEIYYLFHAQLIVRLLDRGASVLVACDINDPNVVFGFLVSEPGVAHFAYVKRPFRRLGILRRLHEESGLGTAFSYTHHMPFCDKLAYTDLQVKAVYVPYLV